jgi:hypothetical protein
MPHKSIFMIASLLASAAPAAADSLRCELRLRTTPVTGGECLDLAALREGAVLATAKNVTRISREGLRFCPGAFQVTTGGSADVVFLVDNSGSMWSTRAYAKSGDTTFLNDGQCGIGTTGGSLVYPVWDDKAAPGPPSPARSVGVLASDPGGACELAGDPYNTRAYVVRKAIDFLATNASASTVGLLGFAASTMNEQMPLGLSDPANVARLKARMRVDSAFGTNYGIAVDGRGHLYGGCSVGPVFAHVANFR